MFARCKKCRSVAYIAPRRSFRHTVTTTCVAIHTTWSTPAVGDLIDVLRGKAQCFYLLSSAEYFYLCCCFIFQTLLSNLKAGCHTDNLKSSILVRPLKLHHAVLFETHTTTACVAIHTTRNMHPSAVGDRSMCCASNNYTSQHRGIRRRCDSHRIMGEMRCERRYTVEIT